MPHAACHKLKLGSAPHVVAGGVAQRVPLRCEHGRDGVRDLHRAELLPRRREVDVVPKLEVARCIWFATHRRDGAVQVEDSHVRLAAQQHQGRSVVVINARVERGTGAATRERLRVHTNTWDRRRRDPQNFPAWGLKEVACREVCRVAL